MPPGRFVRGTCRTASLLSLISSVALAAPLDLTRYGITASYALPAVAASEASAVTYNGDTGNLFVIGDEGTAIAEVTRTGTLVSAMSLTGFDDTEGLAYIGNGQLVVAEERLQDASRLTYVAGGSAARGSLPGVSLGESVGNVGIEGISYDPRDGRFLVVKEKTPQQVRVASVDFAASTAAVADLFTPGLGVADLSDVQTLASVASLAATPEQDNLLIFSQESQRLIEVTRGGVLVSSFSFAGITDSAEGVTIDPSGTIYIVDETPRLYVLNVVPEPAAALIAIGGLVVAASRRRRRRRPGRSPSDCH